MKRINHLKEFTDELKYQDVIDQVAFDQDELYDMLDEGMKEIYLCGEKFVIPLELPGIIYRGINLPIAVINSSIEINWSQRQITIEGMEFDEEYLRTIRGAGIQEKNSEMHYAISGHVGRRIFPNDACPCGSGKKYKYCCGGSITR